MKSFENMLPPLPPEGEIETPFVLKALIHAHRHLVELKSIAKTIPNEEMLISMLALQEAQSSSEIENIITTEERVLPTWPCRHLQFSGRQGEQGLQPFQKSKEIN